MFGIVHVFGYFQLSLKLYQNHHLIFQDAFERKIYERCTGLIVEYIYSFNKHLLNSCYVSVAILGTGDVDLTKADKHAPISRQTV